MKSSGLSDRMKSYEAQYDVRTIPMCPVVARMDGRAFHTFTRGMERPFDVLLVSLMRKVTEGLVFETNARIGYCQSDEISLVFQQETPESEIYFDGRVLKMTSILASTATLLFNRLLPEAFPAKVSAKPVFDARVMSVPSRAEACNYLIWREQDAVRNSIAMAAQAKFSHRELHGVDTKRMQEMLFQRHGINWNDYESRYKRGSYFRRVTKSIPFSAEELAKLPEKHEARRNPGLLVERRVVEEACLPPLQRVVNREEVVFDGAEPRVFAVETTEATATSSTVVA
jgi:tRNA(His) guanylyltransferase